MRAEPAGAFYQRRLLDSDAAAHQRGAKPKLTFEPALAIQAVAESMALGLAFAAALRCKPEQTTLGFGFRWSGLEGRSLVNWAGDRMILPGQYRASDDAAESFVEVPMETAPLAVAPYASRATRGLLAAFNGYTLPGDYVERRVRARLERKP